MADATLSTKFSRRAMLAGASVAALGVAPDFPHTSRRSQAAAPQHEENPFYPHPEENPPHPEEARAYSAEAATPAAKAGRAVSKGPDPDAGLLRRVAAVARLKAEYAGAEAERLRLSEVKFNHPEHPGLLVTRAAHDKYREISEQVGYGPAQRLRGRVFSRYAAATRAAIRTPARTPRGLHAKLALCLDAAWKGELRIYMFEDKAWLECALADLERMAVRFP